MNNQRHRELRRMLLQEFLRPDDVTLTLTRAASTGIRTRILICREKDRERERGEGGRGKEKKEKRNNGLGTTLGRCMIRGCIAMYREDSMTHEEMQHTIIALSAPPRDQLKRGLRKGLRLESDHPAIRW